MFLFFDRSLICAAWANQQLNAYHTNLTNFEHETSCVEWRKYPERTNLARLSPLSARLLKYWNWVDLERSYAVPYMIVRVAKAFDQWHSCTYPSCTCRCIDTKLFLFLCIENVLYRLCVNVRALFAKNNVKNFTAWRYIACAIYLWYFFYQYFAHQNCILNSCDVQGDRFRFSDGQNRFNVTSDHANGRWIGLNNICSSVKYFHDFPVSTEPVLT